MLNSAHMHMAECLLYTNRNVIILKKVQLQIIIVFL